MKRGSRLCAAIMGLFLATSAMLAQDPKVTSVEDCVCVKRIVRDEIAVAPDGRRVAYVLKSADAERNQNQFEVRVRELDQENAQKNGRAVFQAQRQIAQLKWLADSERLILLLGAGEKDSQIIIVNVRNRQQELVGGISTSVSSYSIDDAGGVIAYAGASANTYSNQDPHKVEYGYSIPLGWPEILADEIHPSWGKSQIEVVKRSGRNWQETVRSIDLFAKNDGDEAIRDLRTVRWVSLSPGGDYLAFAYFEESDTDEGAKVGSRLRRIGRRPVQKLGLLNLANNEVELTLTFASISSIPGRWAESGKTFAFASTPPLARENGQQPDDGRFEPGVKGLFALDARTHAVSEIVKPGDWTTASRILECPEGICASLVSMDAAQSFHRFVHLGSHWTEPEHAAPSKAVDLESPSTRDGKMFVGVREAPTTPPDLVAYDRASGTVTILTELNPQFRNRLMGAVERLDWTNHFGANAWGNLIKPTSYQRGEKYPLVILTKGWGNGFICDTEYQTAFPPQPLANAGFLVLEANPPEKSKQLESTVGTPGEAQNWVGMVESAVESLDQRGMIDRNNVGIIGFSRTSWEVDYTLTHSDFKFRAASSADSGLYNYGGYWLTQSAALSFGEEERLYGGPPYGTNVDHWIKYSPSFNAGQVASPLLMEYMGHGVIDEPLYAYEFFTALHRFGKPVELFFYPHGQHELDTPFERIASLQRNVDWFRFWMQGYEGKAPEYDPDQYVRWRKLREQQEWNERTRAQGKDPSAEFLKQTAPGADLNGVDMAPAAKEFVH